MSPIGNGIVKSYYPMIFQFEQFPEQKEMLEFLYQTFKDQDKEIYMERLNALALKFPQYKDIFTEEMVRYETK